MNEDVANERATAKATVIAMYRELSDQDLADRLVVADAKLEALPDTGGIFHSILDREPYRLVRQWLIQELIDRHPNAQDAIEREGAPANYVEALLLGVPGLKPRREWHG